MRRFLLILLMLALPGLCACGQAETEVPAPTATPAPTEAPTPEPTVEPEAPGSGRVLIHVAYVEGTAHPTVTITGREEAARAINTVLDTLSHRLYQVPRGDGAVLSLVYGDADPETPEAFRWGAVNFDSRSGELLTFENLAEDAAGLKALCADFLTEAGISSPSELLTDGNWYLSGEGLAILTESAPHPQAVVIPYGPLLGTLRDPWIPPERLPVEGQLRAAYTVDANVDSTRQLDEVTVSGGMESVLLWAWGDVQDVRAVLVETPDEASFHETALLWYASALEDGESVRLNTTVPEGIPNLKLCWRTDAGAYEALLSRNGQTGKLQLIPLVGELIDPDSPYAHITAQSLLGHWYNDKTGAEEQAISFAGSSICYLWHKGLGYNGEGFLWELQRRDEEGLCPQIVIHAANGDVIYETKELDGSLLTTDAGEFLRAEAVG